MGKIIGRGRIRTFEGISHQIYSLTRLSTSVHARGCTSLAHARRASVGAGSIVQNAFVFNTRLRGFAIAPRQPVLKSSAGVPEADLKVGGLVRGALHDDLIRRV